MRFLGTARGQHRAQRPPSAAQGHLRGAIRDRCGRDDDAICATLPLVRVAYEANERGERYVWLAERWRIGSTRCAGRASWGGRRLPLDAGKTKLPLGAG